MNISPQKFQALTEKITALEIQMAGILTIVGAASKKADRDPSIPGFCERHGFSIGTYKNLRKRGKAPRETLVSANRIIITEEDEAEWLAARQADARDPRHKRGVKRVGEVA